MNGRLGGASTPSTLTLASVAFGLAVTLSVSVLPFVRFAYRSLSAHLVIATAAGVTALMVTYLAGWRLVRRKRWDDLLLVVGLAVGRPRRLRDPRRRGVRAVARGRLPGSRRHRRVRGHRRRPRRRWHRRGRAEPRAAGRDRPERLAGGPGDAPRPRAPRGSGRAIGGRRPARWRRRRLHPSRRTRPRAIVGVSRPRARARRVRSDQLLPVPVAVRALALQRRRAAPGLLRGPADRRREPDRGRS